MRIVSVPGFNPGGHMPRVTLGRQRNRATWSRATRSAARRRVEWVGHVGGAPRGQRRQGPTVPKLLLLTVAEKPEKPFEMWLEKDTAGVEEAAKHLDGVYIEFQQEMLTPEGRAALSQLAARRTVGGGCARADPDNLATATELMNSCGVGFVNTDLPQTFTAAARAAYAEVSVASRPLDVGQAAPREDGYALVQDEEQRRRQRSRRRRRRPRRCGRRPSCAGLDPLGHRRDEPAAGHEPERRPLLRSQRRPPGTLG